MLGVKSGIRLVGESENLLSIATQDKRLAPVYSVPDAAEYLGIPVRTLRAWAIGRRKQTWPDQDYPPVLKFVDQHYRRLSFFDLVEAHILRGAVEKKVPLRNIKSGLEYVRSEYPSEARPLLALSFQTDGKYLLVGGMLGSAKEDILVNASKQGQLEMTSIIEEHLKLIRRGEGGLPDTLYPKNGQRIISITPGILSGRPVVDGTRISTALIAQRILAGEPRSNLVRDYQISEEKIEAALRYEKAA